jgi:hypothetical protein
MTEETNQPEYGQVEGAEPEVQLGEDSSKAIEELVHEMEKKDALNGVVKSEEPLEPVEEKKEPAADPRFSKKFAALSRREKQLKAKEAAYSKRLAELEKRLEKPEPESIPEPVPEIPLKNRLRTDPLKALAEIGLPYEKLTELALNDGNLTPDMQMKLMREEIETGYKSKFEELEKRMSEKDQTAKAARYDRIQKNYLNKVGDFVDKNPETYEFVKANNATNVIYDVVEQHYKESGKILTIKEAADAVESHFEGEAEKLLKLKKVGARLKAFMNQPKEPKTPTPNKPVTLTNAHSQQSLEEQTKRLLSEEESKLEMAKMLTWE